MSQQSTAASTQERTSLASALSFRLWGASLICAVLVVICLVALGASTAQPDKYIGDAIMALFSGCADDAVKAAIAMLRRLAEYNLLRQAEERSIIHIGVGINTGSLMLGTVGGPNRMDGTVISDAVNLAARLETLTKDYGVSLLISHHTFLQLNHPVEYAFRAIDRVTVKGKSEMVFVFEVFEVDPPELRKGKLATKSTFEQALWRYHQDCFEEAAELLQDCLKINPADRAAQIYLERCQAKCENNGEWRRSNGEWKRSNG